MLKRFAAVSAISLAFLWIANEHSRTPNWSLLLGQHDAAELRGGDAITVFHECLLNPNCYQRDCGTNVALCAGNERVAEPGSPDGICSANVFTQCRRDVTAVKCATITGTCFVWTLSTNPLIQTCAVQVTSVDLFGYNCQTEEIDFDPPEDP